DLLLYGDQVLESPELTLPHPRMRSRRFVLEPLARIAPDLAVPPDGIRVSELLSRLPPGERVEIVPWTPPLETPDPACSQVPNLQESP
ncbi:MAG: 2-amino-4-hydroxy-6-hydroxymethyldihydropteridine diphosphokinase, partial [Acidobacteria bacterium]|nr:2-amino-4-hydroxy-6-hydroxymethyldihydropteridine diphosphokinase [Acidobacteriota bacterium]